MMMMMLRRDEKTLLKEPLVVQCVAASKRLRCFIQWARGVYRRWWARFWTGRFFRRKGTATEAGQEEPLPDELTCRVCEYLGTKELGRFAGTRRAHRRVVTAREWDVSLWRAACERRWRGKRYDPLQLFDFRNTTWRRRFFEVEADARRSVASAFDVQSVKRWRVTDLASAETYDVDGWPYRKSMQYVSPTFSSKPADYVLVAKKNFAQIQVSGLPRVNVLRCRADWGWQLRNAHLRLDSLDHRPQPEPRQDEEASFF
mmetsp:Transcript_14316/g.43353  ORF Transcript_14316/g.43353 Transcript_14316/m.43353 type:complete len:258 (-) Transcript_14316:133-906(-)